MFRFKKRFLFFVPALLLSLILLQAFQKGRPGRLGLASYSLFVGAQTQWANMTGHIIRLAEKYIFLLSLRESYRLALMENKKLKARQKAFLEIQRENKNLRRLLDFPLREDFALLPAQITATDLLAQNGIFSINKGRRDGVKKFMGVLHPEGVAGFVFRAGARSAQVVSLLGAPASLPARNQRSRVRGLVTAGAGGLLAFSYPEEEDSLLKKSQTLHRPGDRIVTVALGPFPAGFPVGELIAPPAENSAMAIRPSAPFYALEEVLVILKPVDKISL